MAVQTWTFDPAHSTISFSVRHMVVSRVHGRFNAWTGDLQFDGEAPEQSRFAVRIDAASIDTHESQRDAHLRSADFFDVERFPAITFESRRIERAGEGRFRVVGDLTIHGVSREIALDVEHAGIARDPWGHDRTGFSIRGAIDRRDFGMTFNQVLEAGGLVVGDRVDIAIEIEALKPAAVAA